MVTRGTGQDMAPAAWPWGADGSFGNAVCFRHADFHKEAGTVPERCSCPKHLAREVKEKLSRSGIVMARAALGSCSAVLPSPCSTSVTPDLGPGSWMRLATKHLISGGHPAVLPTELDLVQLCFGAAPPHGEQGAPGHGDTVMDGDIFLPHSGSLLLLPLPAPRGVCEGRPGRI